MVSPRLSAHAHCSHAPVTPLAGSGVASPRAGRAFPRLLLACMATLALHSSSGEAIQPGRAMDAAQSPGHLASEPPAPTPLVLPAQEEASPAPAAESIVPISAAAEALPLGDAIDPALLEGTLETGADVQVIIPPAAEHSLPTLRALPVAPEASAPVEPPLPTPAPETSPSPFEVPRVLDFRPPWLSAFAVRPRLRLAVVRDSNIFLTPENETADTLITVTPGVSIGAGDAETRKETFLGLSYDISALSFLENPSANALENSLRVAGLYAGPKLSIRADGVFLDLTSPDRELEERTRRLITGAGIGLHYQFTKLEAQLEFRMQHVDYERGVDRTEQDIGLMLEFPATERLSLGAAFHAGRVTVEQGTAQDYQQFLLHAELDGAAKLRFTAIGGLELRDFGGETGQEWNGVFNLSAEYRPFSGTLLALEAFRRTSPSARTVQQNYVSTGVAIRAKQRLFRRFTAGMTAGFETLAYDQTSSSIAQPREDQYFVFRSSLAYDLVQWCSAEVFGEVRRNDSSLERVSFETRVFGVALNARF